MSALSTTKYVAKRLGNKPYSRGQFSACDLDWESEVLQTILKSNDSRDFIWLGKNFIFLSFS